MKKLGTLALTLTLTGAMTLPALAAEEPELVIAPADTGYGQTIVLNGETLDLTGIPGVYVPLKDTLEGFRAIVDGEMDPYPEAAFYNVGTLENVLEKSKKIEAGAL